MASLNLAQLLTILFTVMAASEVSAAPIRRFVCHFPASTLAFPNTKN